MQTEGLLLRSVGGRKAPQTILPPGAVTLNFRGLPGTVEHAILTSHVYSPSCCERETKSR